MTAKLNPNIVVALQARTNSSRLPGKVLLPIAGLPLVVLAAKRAEAPSWNVLTLTSIEQTDDYLCQVLKQYGQDYFRGSLDNVLERYVDSLSKLDDSTIVVRLTADNVFPDSIFINDLIKQFEQKNVGYMCADNKHSLLPYGFSAEVTRLVYLREAFLKASSQYDLEHVTPYIKRLHGIEYYTPPVRYDYSELNCTVDTLTDYLHVAEVFSGITNPITIDGYKLIKKIKPDEIGVSKLSLGCAQLGLNYGVANSQGKPTLEKAHGILTAAANFSCSFFDTARAYGDSELVIGEWLKNNKFNKVKIITKLDTLSSLTPDCSTFKVESAVRNSIETSLSSLGINKIDVLMLHRAKHLYEFGGLIFSNLLDLQKQSLINELGVSVQSPSELLNVVDNPLITHIQLPFNILDYRWSKAIELIRAQKLTRKLTIHVRSIFLQGLLLSKDGVLWNQAGVENYNSVISWLTETSKKYGQGTIHKLCLNFVSSQDWVDSLVCGVDDPEQLSTTAGSLSTKPLTSVSLNQIEAARIDLVRAEALDPSTWKC
ncbi:MAG TPA: hypothetical protein DEF74_03590 [Pseudoalteromonas sp.]|nr:hypothetical protein [Pseudoalteromonas sp.]|tara:strand:- start:16542 stop:18167 length:1626 start_codon:yes stop_codon:yes gene_type:complete